MGKVIVYAAAGLVTLGLLLGLGFTVKMVALMFLGKRKKEIEREPLSHSRGCPCSLCRPGGPDGMYQHHRS